MTIALKDIYGKRQFTFDKGKYWICLFWVTYYEHCCHIPFYLYFGYGMSSASLTYNLSFRLSIFTHIHNEGDIIPGIGFSIPIRKYKFNKT